MIKWFQEIDIENFDGLKAWADVNNHHIDIVWEKLPDESMLYETLYRDRTGDYCQAFVIYDSLNDRATVIYDNIGKIKINSPKYRNIRDFAFNQMLRLRKLRNY